MNSAERYRRAMELFHEVCDLPAFERSTFLSRACGDDGALRRAVELLVQHDSESCTAVEAGEQGEGVRALSAAAGGSEADLPIRIGPYRVVRVIGRGGMGVVFEAEQESPRRTVAVKVLHGGIGASSARRRFQREANLLGRLQHPGIAQVFEAGLGEVEARSGMMGIQPYFAMELIEGRALDRHARERALGVAERLALFGEVCDGVQHAHERGIVHRDLKPSNIMVTDAGRPKILDFGVSRATNADIHTVTLQTDAGQLIGTIPYMSPEQVLGDPEAIDAQSDVYSLGVVLYELLAGELPYAVRHLTIAESVRTIRDEEPRRLGSVERRFRGDIETIVAKSLEKEKSRRYASAAELAADIRRYLRDEPIVARPAGTIYTVKKFARRNRALVGGVAATFLVLLLGAAGTTVGLVSSLRANEKLEASNRALAETNSELAQSNRNLQEVSEFQSSQLTGIDVPLMGTRIRRQLLASVPADRRAGLEAHIGGTNFVDFARSTLEENYFNRAIEMVDAQFADQPVLQASLLQDLATTMKVLGLFGAATDPQRRALETRRRELGDDYGDTLESISQTAMLLQRQGEYAEAEALFRELLETYRRLHGEDHALVFGAWGYLGELYRLQARMEEAEDAARRSWEGLSALAGTDDERTASAGLILAAILNELGRYEEAEALARGTLAVRRRVLGDEHIDTLSAAGNLSIFLMRQGEYDESASLVQEVYEIRRRVLGENHPDTLSSMAEYAARLSNLGKYDKAEPLLVDALERYRDLHGEDHLKTLNTADLLASIYSDQARLDEAVPMLEDILQRRRRVLGAEHQATLRSLGNLGSALISQGKLEEALPLFRDALGGLRSVYGNDHPHTMTAIGNLATLYTRLGRHEDAEPLYHESLERRRALLGEDHPSTLNAVFNFGNMLLWQGKPAEAEPYCMKALEGYTRVGGEDHIGTLYSLSLVGKLRVVQGRHGEAAEYYAKAVERRRRVNGDDHPETLAAVENLAVAMEDTGDWSGAERWRAYLRDAAVRAEPEDTGAVAKSLGLLGYNLMQQEKHGEAESTLAACVELCKSNGLSDVRKRWYAQSLLGEVVGRDPARHVEAERLLVEAAENIVRFAEDAGSVGAADSEVGGAEGELPDFVREARERVADFFMATGRPEEAGRWRRDGGGDDGGGDGGGDDGS